MTKKCWRLTKHLEDISKMLEEENISKKSDNRSEKNYGIMMYFTSKVNILYFLLIIFQNYLPCIIRWIWFITRFAERVLFVPFGESPSKKVKPRGKLIFFPLHWECDRQCLVLFFGNLKSGEGYLKHSQWQTSWGHFQDVEGRKYL